MVTRPDFLRLLLISLLSSCAALRSTDHVASNGTAQLPDRSRSPAANVETLYDIETDVDQLYPTTGSTVHYTLEVSNATCDQDGSGPRPCLLVDGQYPGPTLRARWGDILAVTIVNAMQNNGTSIHFHGVRQLNSPASDGVNGITQCAIAPNDSATYVFQATQHGSSWYHSHSSVQYGDGVFGPIIFDGPAIKDYDMDLGPYVINDIFGTSTAWQIAAIAQENLMHQKGSPLWTNLLINGTAVNATGAGKYNTVSIRNGKRYRLRLINSSALAYIRVSLDNHSLVVIAADFVPIKPYNTSWLLLSIGQRYDVIISADQGTGSYWFRANSPYSCYGVSPANGTAIWTYETNPSIPSSLPNVGEPSSCTDEFFTPLWPEKVPSTSFTDHLGINVTKAVVTPEGRSIVVWTLNNPIWTNYSDPTIGYVMRGDMKYPKLYNTINAQPGGKWNYWLIVNDLLPPLPHPVHLHGHNFYVIGSGTGIFDETKADLNWQTPIRRDTQSVPGDGWLAIAFKSDNPGTWLMHCHIGIHLAEGLGMQYIESPGSMTLPDAAQYNKTCGNWVKYQTTALYTLQDSGL